MSKFSALAKRRQSTASSQEPKEKLNIMQGIQSLHGWMSAQTKITPKIKKKTKIKNDSEEEDDEDADVTIKLTSNNPQQLTNVVNFDFNQKEFAPPKMRLRDFSESMIDHLEIMSTIFHKDSKEAQNQSGVSPSLSILATIAKKASVFKTKRINQELYDDETDDDNSRFNSKIRDSRSRKDSNASDFSDSGEQRKNQFSFVERATQTKTGVEKSIEIQTDPPGKLIYCDTVNQWIIYDTYKRYERLKEDREKVAEAEELEKEAAEAEVAAPEVKPVRRRLIESHEEADDGADKKTKMLVSGKILERMVSQNSCFEIAQDFRFYEDPSDEFKDFEGTLLPLWEFSNVNNKSLEITALCWNNKYSDMFAAGFGSYNFYLQSEPGYACIFSLKNPSYPEFTCSASCGVMCVDISPQHPHMVVTGLHDGNVAVYNLQLKSSAPVYQSSPRNGKHRDVVWQVKWAPDNLDGYLNFFSISADGRVTNWTIVKSKLWSNDILEIPFSKPLANLENVEVNLLDGGQALAFKPDDDSKFLVGTDLGLVYYCTTEYCSEFLARFRAHQAPVYSVEWNTFSPSIFMTCAAEWVIKIWDVASVTNTENPRPLFTFDLGGPVGDVAWAPYSSTVFAGASAEGKIHVYDLHINKYNPICVQGLTPDLMGSHYSYLSFNPTHPIVIVGDTRGHVVSVKLSPNLRKLDKGVRSALQNKDTKKAGEMEILKLEKVLSQVREPQKKDEKELY